MVISEYVNILEKLISMTDSESNDTFFMNPIDKRKVTLEGYSFVYSDLIEVDTVHLLPNYFKNELKTIEIWI